MQLKPFFRVAPTHTMEATIRTAHELVTSNSDCEVLPTTFESEADAVRRLRVRASKWFYWAGNSMCVPVLETIIYLILKQ